MVFRIYYGDGSTFSDADGDPFDAPGDNVQAVVAADAEHGRIVWVKHNFYWWQDGQWFGGDQWGLWDYLRQPGPKKVIFARTLSNALFQEVVKRALADPDFPVKTARAPDEEF